MEISAEVSGFEELEKLLRELPEIAQRRVYREALSAAGKPIAKAARTKAPTKNIRRNIVKKLNRRGSRLGEFTVSILARKAYNRYTKVGSRRIKKNSEKDAYDSLWYEFGRRGQPATPFLRPAFDENKGNAREIFRKEMKQRIEAEIAKKRAR